MLSRVERFERLVMPEPNSGCWLWLGVSWDGRYGKFYWKKKKPVRAHRAAWALFRGEIPAGKVVCHKCDNVFCANPDHLFVGTQHENNTDRHRKGRSGRHYGEHSGVTKLTEAIVREIRTSGLPTTLLAPKYGVTKSAIDQARRGYTWSHVI